MHTNLTAEDRLKLLRRRHTKNLTLDAVALKIGVILSGNYRGSTAKEMTPHRSTISRWESGHIASIPRYHLAAWKQALSELKKVVKTKPKKGTKNAA